MFSRRTIALPARFAAHDKTRQPLLALRFAPHLELFATGVCCTRSSDSARAPPRCRERSHAPFPSPTTTSACS
eukprot:1867650-Pleurochrysis_carterae.AAC.2